MSIPNILTLLRLAAIPVFALVYLIPSDWAHPVAALIFILAALTDWLDGYLARVLKQDTRLGAFLDPVADKLLVAVALVLVVGQNYLSWLAIPAAIIVGREIVISALREWMAELGKRASIAVTWLGKIKTTVQMIALILLIAYYRDVPSIVLWSGAVLLLVAAMLTLWSMINYIKIAWPDLTLSQEE